MTDKITLTPLSDINGVISSAVTTLNANFALIQAWADTVLSLDGTTPNSMGANLDMDGFRILNLPTPTNPTDPVRLEDLGSTPDVLVFPSLGSAPSSPVPGQTYFNTNTNHALGWNGSSWVQIF